MQNWSAAPDMEKEYKVRMTDYALEQMDEVQQYIAISLAAPDTASRWREHMKKELASLSQFPNRVPLTEEEPWHSEGVHKMVVGKHLAYFWIDENSFTVWITAVVYGSRDQRRQLSEMPL